MPKINILTEQVAQLIAAGEVVERPGSVVKEMVENSIDAGATAITVEIRNGGNTFLRVSDNGCGIAREDCPAAFMPHATSKICTGEDLDAIATLGFRGEALASVASVARVEMRTKTAEEEMGTRLLIEGGDIVDLDDVGCPDGTVITVRDLFFNTPARRKFLKKDMTEAANIAGIMERMALSHPEISFTLRKETGEVLYTPGDGNLMTAVSAVLGREVAEGMLPVEYPTGQLTVTGVTGRPSRARPNRNMQIFFLNGRFIRSKTFSAAVEQAYKDRMMVGKFPACVLNVSVPYGMVDVNVHPSKLEVRFADEQTAFRAVYYAVKTALDSSDSPAQGIIGPGKQTSGRVSATRPADFADQPSVQSSLFPKNKGGFYTLDLSQGPTLQKTAEQADLSTVKATNFTVIPEEDLPFIVPQEPKNEVPLRAENAYRVAGHHAPYPYTAYAPATLNKPVAMDVAMDLEKEKETTAAEPIAVREAVAERKTAVEEETAKIIKRDPATAEGPTERMPQPSCEEGETEGLPYRYVGEAFDTYILAQRGDSLYFVDKHALHERILYEQLKAGQTTFSQPLLTPLPVSLTKEEYVAILDNADRLAEVGFDLSDFGDGTVLVRAMPMHYETADVADSLTEIAGKLIHDRFATSTDKVDWLFRNVACRAAIKAGTKSSPRELMDLLSRIDDVHYCPHGRPVTLEMTRQKLEKEFHRTT